MKRKQEKTRLYKQRTVVFALCLLQFVYCCSLEDCFALHFTLLAPFTPRPFCLLRASYSSCTRRLSACFVLPAPFVLVHFSCLPCCCCCCCCFFLAAAYIYLVRSLLPPAFCTTLSFAVLAPFPILHHLSTELALFPHASVFSNSAG